MGALIMLILVVWIIQSDEMGEAQWAGVVVLVALALLTGLLAWTERAK